MTDNALEILRNTIKSLRSLRKNTRARRRELVQFVAGAEIEMVSARIGSAIRQLEAARDLYNQQCSSDDDAPRAEVPKLKTDFRGRDFTRTTNDPPEGASS